MAFDKFTRPSGVISVAMLVEDAGIETLGQFMYPSDALAMIAANVGIGFPLFVTIRGVTVATSDFVTREHAFRWVNDLSVWGHVREETLTLAKGEWPLAKAWHGQGERPPIPPLPSDAGLSRYFASNPLPPPVGEGPFEVETVGHMEGSRVIVTGKAFRLLRVGQSFRHAAASPMVWVKTGSRTFRQRVDGYAHGPTHTVSNMAMLVVLEP